MAVKRLPRHVGFGHGNQWEEVPADTDTKFHAVVLILSKLHRAFALPATQEASTFNTFPNNINIINAIVILTFQTMSACVMELGC